VTARGRARPRSRRVKSSSVFNRSGTAASPLAPPPPITVAIFCAARSISPDICRRPSPDRSRRAFLRARDARGRSRAGSSSSSRRLNRRGRQTIGETNAVGDCEIYRTPRRSRSTEISRRSIVTRPFRSDDEFDEKAPTRFDECRDAPDIRF